MLKMLVSLAGLAGVAGCAGLEITTLKADQVSTARTTGNALNGYVVYEPIVAIELSTKEVCLGGKDEKGNCKSALVTQCAATLPFTLPDYTRPYLVTSKTGFGKAGVEVAIADGWRLSNIKDSSDNTALLSALGVKTASASDKGTQCRTPGLYRLPLDGSGQLVPLQLY